MKRYGAVTLLKTSFLFNEIFLSAEDLADRLFYIHFLQLVSTLSRIHELKTMWIINFWSFYANFL